MKILESLKKLGKWINLDCNNSNIKFLYEEELKVLKNFTEKELIDIIHRGELDFYEKFLGKCGKHYYSFMKSQVRMEIVHKKLNTGLTTIVAVNKFKNLIKK